MTGIPETPDGPDLAALRVEIDELENQSTDELVSPTPAALVNDEPTPHPTDAIGSEKWEDKA